MYWYWITFYCIYLYIFAVFILCRLQICWNLIANRASDFIADITVCQVSCREHLSLGPPFYSISFIRFISIIKGEPGWHVQLFCSESDDQCRKPKSGAARRPSVLRRGSHDDGSVETLHEPSLVLILKWGGELTPAGKIQAEELGKAFRCMYPGGQGTSPWFRPRFKLSP